VIHFYIKKALEFMSISCVHVNQFWNQVVHEIAKSAVHDIGVLRVSDVLEFIHAIV
jgi:hypothetical protein